MSRPGIRDSGNLTAMPAPLWDSTFLRACRGEATTHTPVWLMRQAGRYMPHYRAIRARSSFLSLCKDPALSAEVAIHARAYLGVDAAIVFSDILVVLEALGMPLEFTAGDGPKLTAPLRVPAQVSALRAASQAAADLDYVHRTVGLTIAGLPAHIPCIGFCGGPFTLASYAIEGGSSRHFILTKTFMYREPAAWAELMERLVQTLAAHLILQIRAGATCVQIFESWGGALNRADFARYVAPALRSLVALLPSGIPVIAFAAGAGHLQELIAGCGADVLGPSPAANGMPPSARSRATSIPACCWPRPSACSKVRRRCWPRPQGGPATSSTSGMACSRRPTPSRRGAWWPSCRSPPAPAATAGAADAGHAHRRGRWRDQRPGCGLPAAPSTAAGAAHHFRGIIAVGRGDL